MLVPDLFDSLSWRDDRLAHKNIIYRSRSRPIPRNGNHQLTPNVQIRAFSQNTERRLSDSDDRDFAAGSPDEPFYISTVAGEDHGSFAKRRGHHNGVDDIHRSAHTQQPSRLVRLALVERNHHAPGQEPSELRLLVETG